MIGETVGEYKITAAQGQGAVGESYDAEHATTGAKAVVEIAGGEIAGKPEAVAKLVEDLKKIATIKQANIHKVLDAGTDAAGRAFVVSAPPEGELLSKRIETQTRLSITQICEVARQIANGLAAVHDEGVIHGELSSSCIALLPAGALARGEPAKVMRAGLAGAKRAASIKLDPTYTAPEVWSANSSDWRIDAYSLGCVMFEMATGKPPYPGKSPEEIRAKHLSAPTPSARSQMPDVPPTLDVMLGRLLSKAPEDRYGSMREIARALDALVAQSGKSFAPTATDTPALQISDEDKERLMGSAGVTSGELKARPAPPPEQTMRPEVPVPMPQPVKSEFPGAGRSAGDTDRMRKQGGSKVAIIVILIVILVGGGAAVAMML